MKRTISILITFIVCFSICSCGENEPSKSSLMPENHVCTYFDYPTSFNDEKYMYEVDEKRNVLENFDNMYQAEVVKTADPDYPYFIYLMGWAAAETNPGWPGCDAIFLARSKNLVDFEMYCGLDSQNQKVWDTTYKDEAYGGREAAKKWTPIITPDTDKWYDNWHNGDPTVVYKDDIFYMAYSSYCSDIDGKFSWEEGDTDGDLSCIMGATSDDGINFTKSNSPIFIWEEEIGKNEPVTGNSKLKISFDAAGKQFYGLYHRPSIMFDEGKWKIWFDYIPGIDRVLINDDGTQTAQTKGMSTGYAENKGDFMKKEDWTLIKGGKTPAIYEFTNPDIIKVKNTYYAYGDPSIEYYGGYFAGIDDPSGWAKRQIVEAVSFDGINFTVKGFIKPDSDTKAMHVPQAYYEDGHIFLFYATQIGRKLDKDYYNYKYDFIRMATKCIE